MKINIIGGSGFIGTNLSRRLLKNPKFEIEIIDIKKSEHFPRNFKFGDVTSPASLSKCLHSDVIINLAAEHKDNVTPKNLYYEVNVQGARNICSFANKASIKKIIFTSSVAVYGFCQIGTNESGAIAPFGEYGRTKWKAEQVFKKWQAGDPRNRTLVIIRPTVVFGEGNRGNVYNLLWQIALGKFIMVGDGLNRKSMAYVENIAAFIEYSLNFKPGIHIYNYIDKPDFTMNKLVALVNNLMGRPSKIKFRLPYSIGFFIGFCFDLFGKIVGRKFSISAIRVKKFCANSVYESNVGSTGFVPQVSLIKAIEKTVRFEFIESNKNKQVFYSE
jgi:nucleoside-diphosphate-sugar epimerase